MEQTSAVVFVDRLPVRRASMLAFLTPWATAQGLVLVSNEDEAGDLPIACFLVNTGDKGVEDVPLALLERSAQVVILADSADPPRMIDAWNKGIFAYVPLTMDESVVLAALRLVLAGGRFYPALIVEPFGRKHSGSGITNDSALTERQREILEALTDGCSNKIIARKLNITEATVKIHVRHIMRKTGAANRTQAALANMRDKATLEYRPMPS